jgi:hypothetical protein
MAEFSVESLLSAVLAVALVLLDKAGKLSGPTAAVLLLVMLVLLLAAVRKLPWITKAIGFRAKGTRAILPVVFVVSCVTLFGRWIWPSLRHPTASAATERTTTEPASVTSTPSNSALPKTLHEYFLADFNNVAAAEEPGVITVGDDPTPIRVQVRLHLDFDAKAEFVSVYIPRTKWTYLLCGRVISGGYKTAFRALKGGTIAGGMIGDTRFVRDAELKFTGALFIYHEVPLFADQIDEMTALSRRHGLILQLRGPEYAFARNNPPATPFKIP